MSYGLSNGQSFCHTPSFSPNSNLDTASSSLSAAPQILKVYYHVIRQSDGTGGYLQNDVIQAHSILEYDFNPHGIYFSWDGCIDYIDDDEYFTSKTSGIYQENNHVDGIDIYLFPVSHVSSGGRANGVGGSTEFWVSGTWPGSGPVALSHIISHEMGHVLFLWHTHHGTFPEGGDPGECPELVDGSNAAYCGDYVIDSPADPFIAFNVDANCNWLGFGTDANGDPYDPDENIIMAYTDPNCMQYFTEGQGQRMIQAILTLSSLQQCVVNQEEDENYCDCESVNIIIYQNTTLDDEYWFSGNLEIINNAQLTVTDKLHFSDNYGILVHKGSKLIVEGGHLTSCEPNGNWPGVSVNGGGNSDFDVKMTNGAIIENAKTAVSMYPHSVTWPAHQTNDNGILIAENSSFLNCDRAAAFISHTPQENESEIKNCLIDGGVDAITNWNCQGIAIYDNTTIENVSNSCVLTIDGSFNIDDCSFTSGKNDVVFLETLNSYSSRLTYNDFNGPTGVRADGASFSFNLYKDNIFLNTERGIDFEGDHLYNVENNTFNGSPVGMLCANTGNHSTNAWRNEFNGNAGGLWVEGFNGDFKFEENCFTTTFGDVLLAGHVSDNQGWEDDEAGNCFSSSHNLDLWQIAGNAFQYYLFPDEVLDCKDVQYTGGSFTVVDASNENDGSNFCGAPQQPGESSEIGDLFTMSNAEIITYRSGLESQIAQLENSANPAAHEGEISSLKAHLYLATRFLIERYMEDGNVTAARNLMDPANNIDDALLLYSSYVSQSDYINAGVALSSIPTTSAELQDYVWVQQLNLQRLSQRPSYQPTPGELATLHSIAQKQDPYAAYARGLYYVFTGNMIDFEYQHSGVNARASAIEADYTVKIYPNPVMHDLQIDIQGLDLEDEVEIRITDMMGHTHSYAANANGQTSIATEGWPSGIYFVDIRSGNRLIKQQKIAVTK